MWIKHNVNFSHLNFQLQVLTNWLLEMIKYDLIYVIYVNGTYIYMSDRREYTERMEHVEVLQMKHGQRRDKYLRQQREQRPGFRHLRYERSRLYLANPDFDLAQSKCWWYYAAESDAAASEWICWGDSPYSQSTFRREASGRTQDVIC